MTTFSEHLARWNNHRAAWMEQPEKWIWAGPNGAAQGPAAYLPANPGMANLLWLAMDLAAPPHTYDSRANGLYIKLVLQAHSTNLNSLPLFDQAGSLTLEQFRCQCETGSMYGPLAPQLPLLKLLADRRLRHAHT